MSSETEGDEPSFSDRSRAVSSLVRAEQRGTSAVESSCAAAVVRAFDRHVVSIASVWNRYLMSSVVWKLFFGVPTDWPMADVWETVQWVAEAIDESRVLGPFL